MIMAKYSGSGWHFQYTRHSNARKYGKAGGKYAEGKHFHIDTDFEGRRLVDQVEVFSKPKKFDKKVLVYSPKLRSNILISKKELVPYAKITKDEQKLNDETMKELNDETDEEYAERIDNKCDVHIPQNKKHFGEAQREYGFDLTDFKSAEDFKNLLKIHGLTKYRKEKKYISTSDKGEYYYNYTWTNKDGTLKIITGNNPITGAYDQPKYRQKEKGYASYIGITGDNDKVQFLAKDIKNIAKNIKGENETEREFI
jgi:hypothetical protein